jgi:hypothetical protein
MKRRTKGVLLVGGLTVATALALVVMLVGGPKVVDPHNYCETGFSKVAGCTYHWSSRSTRQGTPIFPSSPANTVASSDTFRPDDEAVAWAIAKCPQNYIGERPLCAVPPVAEAVQAGSNDPVTDLPRPKPWLLTTAKASPFITAVYVETPLELAGVLGFYRAELSKRGWTENDGAVVEPDKAVIAFTTSNGPALLRLTHQADRTIVDLSLRKPTAKNLAWTADIQPEPGQVRLRLGNNTDEEAVITINEQTIKLAANAGKDLTRGPATGRKLRDSQEISLPPGKYKVALKVASGAEQNREFEVAADETWGLVADSYGTLVPLHLY